jgi:hypothetical protein
LPARYFRSQRELIPLRPGRGGTEWVLAREWCLYANLACAQVPVARRRDFISTQVRKLAPFDDPEWHAAYAGDFAQVWIWSRAAVRAGTDFASDARRLQCLPESVLRGEPRSSGTELLSDHEGCEGRSWKAGNLVASTWWPQLPGANEWAAFCRSAGLHPDAVPEPLDLPMSEQAWSQTSSVAQLGQTLSHYRREAILAAVALLVLLFAMQLGSIAHLWWARHGVQQQLVTERNAISDVLAARNRAEIARAASEQLMALHDKPSQLALIAGVSAHLPGTGWTIVQWFAPDPRHIEITLSSARPDPPAIVRALEGSGVLHKVSANLAQSSSNELLIRAVVGDRADTSASEAVTADGGDGP